MNNIKELWDAPAIGEAELALLQLQRSPPHPLSADIEQLKSAQEALAVRSARLSGNVSVFKSLSSYGGKK